jgi:hypothetical protein
VPHEFHMLYMHHKTFTKANSHAFLPQKPCLF